MKWNLPAIVWKIIWNSMEKFNETCLTCKQHCCNSMNDENILDEQCEHAITIWGNISVQHHARFS